MHCNYAHGNVMAFAVGLAALLVLFGAFAAAATGALGAHTTVALTALRVPAVVAAGAPASVEISLANVGNSSVAGLLVLVTVDGATVASDVPLPGVLAPGQVLWHDLGEVVSTSALPPDGSSRRNVTAVVRTHNVSFVNGTKTAFFVVVPVLSLPIVEGFESMDGGRIRPPQSNMTGLPGWAYAASLAAGELTTNYAQVHSGIRSAALARSGCCGDVSNVLTVTINASGVAGRPLALKFWLYDNNDGDSPGGDIVEVRGCAACRDLWIRVADLWGFPRYEWFVLTESLSEVMAAAGQRATESLQVRFRQLGFTYLNRRHGLILDDVEIFEAPQEPDVSLLSLYVPSVLRAGVPGQAVIELENAGFGPAPAHNVSLSLFVDGTLVVSHAFVTAVLLSQQVVSFDFGNVVPIAGLVEGSPHNVTVVAFSATSDVDAANDVISTSFVVVAPLAIPYTTSFEGLVDNTLVPPIHNATGLFGWDYTASDPKGLITTNYAPAIRTGTRSLGLARHSAGGKVTNSLVVTFDASEFAPVNITHFTRPLALRFWLYDNSDVDDVDDDIVWIRGCGACNDPWLRFADLFVYQRFVWHEVTESISAKLREEGQECTSTLQIRFTQRGAAYISRPRGLVVDDVSVTETPPIPDVAAVDLYVPSVFRAGVPGSAVVRIENVGFSATPAANVTATLLVDGNVVVVEIPVTPRLGSQEAISFDFGDDRIISSTGMSSDGATRHNVTVVISSNTSLDAIYANNMITRFFVVVPPLSFPHYQDFENITAAVVVPPVHDISGLFGYDFVCSPSGGGIWTAALAPFAGERALGLARSGSGGVVRNDVTLTFDAATLAPLVVSHVTSPLALSFYLFDNGYSTDTGRDALWVRGCGACDDLWIKAVDLVSERLDRFSWIEVTRSLSAVLVAAGQEASSTLQLRFRQEGFTYITRPAGFLIDNLSVRVELPLPDVHASQVLVPPVLRAGVAATVTAHIDNNGFSANSALNVTASVFLDSTAVVLDAMLSSVLASQQHLVKVWSELLDISGLPADGFSVHTVTLVVKSVGGDGDPSNNVVSAKFVIEKARSIPFWEDFEDLATSDAIQPPAHDAQNLVGWDYTASTPYGLLTTTFAPPVSNRSLYSAALARRPTGTGVRNDFVVTLDATTGSGELTLKYWLFDMGQQDDTSRDGVWVRGCAACSDPWVLVADLVASPGQRELWIPQTKSLTRALASAAQEFSASLQVKFTQEGTTARGVVLDNIAIDWTFAPIATTVATEASTTNHAGMSTTNAAEVSTTSETGGSFATTSPLSTAVAQSTSATLSRTSGAAPITTTAATTTAATATTTGARSATSNGFTTDVAPSATTAPVVAGSTGLMSSTSTSGVDPGFRGVSASASSSSSSAGVALIVVFLVLLALTLAIIGMVVFWIRRRRGGWLAQIDIDDTMESVDATELHSEELDSNFDSDNSTILA